MSLALTDHEQDTLHQLCARGSLEIGDDVPVSTACRFDLAGLAKIAGGDPQTLVPTTAARAFRLRTVE